MAYNNILLETYSKCDMEKDEYMQINAIQIKISLLKVKVLSRDLFLSVY